MSHIDLKCPYCDISLSLPEKVLNQKQTSVRCKFCYGVFSFFPYNNRIQFNKNRNHYEVFGIERNAGVSAIKSRFRDLVLKFHPDRQKDKEFYDNKMKHINYIYSILSDAVLKKQYDSTLGFDEEFEEALSNYKPPVYIYQDSVEIIDSDGLKSIIRDRNYIYFPVDQYISIFRKRIPLNIKGHQGVMIQRIFNPKYKDNYEKILGKKLEKEPIFCISFGADEMIIYKEDFQRIWLSQKSLNKRDMRKVMVYSAVIITLITLGLMYLYNTYTWIVNEDGQMVVLKKVK